MKATIKEKQKKTNINIKKKQHDDKQKGKKVTKIMI